MDWRLDDAGRAKRVAVLVSREEHCLLELLWRWRRGELHGDIPLVISNHPDHASDVAGFGARYEHVPGQGREAGGRGADAGAARGGDFDLVVLARYMQILAATSSRARLPGDQHPPLVPARLRRRRPVPARAERGVKIIGATAHYVTEELDAGPIIEQDVVRMTHREGADQLARIGRRRRAHRARPRGGTASQDRVLVHENRTVVF